MKIASYAIRVPVILLIGVACRSVQAQTVNIWRGDAVSAEWNQAPKWKLKHPPQEGEAAHFREANSVISVNSTIQLDKGMHLYGQELLLKGNGNINLWSLVPHERTVNIPASATGYANLTLCDNLSLNGLISLSAKGFGTSASKGTLTLKDRATVTGGLLIGNEGVGSGQVIVKDNATFHITSLELNTKAATGGLAEIHILGGTVRIETEGNPFDAFMADPSCKIIIGDTGTLRVESELPIEEKKELIKALISSNHLIAAPGCRLTAPVLQEEMLIARAENAQFKSGSDDRQSLFAAIDSISNAAPVSSTSTSDLGNLVKALHEEVSTQTAAPSGELPEATTGSSPRVAGYIAFFGSIMLVLRRATPVSKG